MLQVINQTYLCRIWFLTILLIYAKPIWMRPWFSMENCCCSKAAICGNWTKISLQNQDIRSELPSCFLDFRRDLKTSMQYMSAMIARLWYLLVTNTCCTTCEDQFSEVRTTFPHITWTIRRWKGWMRQWYGVWINRKSKVKKTFIGSPVFAAKNNKTMLFTEDCFWRFDDELRKLDEYYPRYISRWRGIPTHLDAAVTLPNSKTYFFKGLYYWVYNNDFIRPEKGFPRKISTLLNCV